MGNCDLDYRTCGHCKVCFDGPVGFEVRPFCDKAGFWQMLFGNDWCPNAPLIEDTVQKTKEKNNEGLHDRRHKKNKRSLSKATRKRKSDRYFRI